MLRTLLTHPLMRGLDIDDPATTELRRRMIREKPFLRKLYREWYEKIAECLPSGDEPVLEIGSGAGFLRELVPHLIPSEVFRCSEISVVLDARRLPISDGVLRGIVMIDVLHHLARPRSFFSEAARCVKPGGVIIMIEPWVTLWSRFIFSRFHSEPFRPEASEWELEQAGPLSTANGALPWIIFERDRSLFEAEFPQWKIKGIRLHTPFRYLLSGGVSLRSLMPGWSFKFWRGFENAYNHWMKYFAMFAHIVLLRS